MAGRRCSICNSVLTSSNWIVSKNRKSGIDSRCRDCNRKRIKAWRSANPEAARARDKAYKDANRDKVRAQFKDWYDRNAESQRERAREWYANNKDKARARYLANKEQHNRNARAWAKANPEKAREIDRRFKKRHRVTLLVKQRQRYRDNIEANRANARDRARQRQVEKPDEVRALRRRFYKSHRDDICAGQKARYQSDETLRHKRRTQARAWALAHPEEALARTRAWKKAHPEAGVQQAAKRRARVAGVSHTLTRSEWARTLEYFGHRCAYCRKPSKRLAQDHVIAISRGGGHTEENVVPCCKSCNSKKHNKPVWVMAGK